MSALTPEKVASVAIQAGFRGEALVTAIAVAHAESGFRADAVGDKNLTEKGECSIGLWQINYRPSRDAAGSLRDPGLNLDPLHNAVAAFAISSQGRSFRPWSTFTNGSYRQFMSAAAATVAALQKGNPMAPDADPLVIPCQAPVVALEPTPSGNGYWIICSDGEVFAFGDATYHGRVQGPAKV